MLIQPIQRLANRLSNFKLEKQNEKLGWKGNDAIGQLIEEYNQMVDKVEITTKELIQREREGAWQIMAKQIAHEINNKLTPLQLNTQFLSRLVGNLDPSESASIQRITKQLEQKIIDLSKVAKQFNLFAKLDTPQVESIVISDYLPQFLNNYQQKEGIQYNLNMEAAKENTSTIQIDPKHLEEVLEHLITKAEATIDGEPNGTILFHLATNQQDVTLSIIDNGPKIDFSQDTQIFDPTFSTTTSQTGLGLPICKRIIEFYAGTLIYQSKVETGNQFIITLPK